MNRSNPEISVLMPIYNSREDHLRASIESILNQTFTDFEFLIVLDGPTDGSDRIVKEYAEKDDRIRILEHEFNMGIVRSLNDGLENVRGKYIARMDSDDISMLNRFDKQKDFLEKGSYDFVASRIGWITSDGKQTGKIYPPTIKGGWSGKNQKSIAKLLRCINFMAHPAWFMKREVAETLKGYRDISSAEDYDFLLRALTHDIHMGIMDDVLLLYRDTEYGVSNSALLKQSYISAYLRLNASRLEDVDHVEIDDYLKDKLSEDGQLAYLNGFKSMIGSVDKIRKFHIASGCIGLIKSLSIHPYLKRVFWDNLIFRIKMHL